MHQQKLQELYCLRELVFFCLQDHPSFPPSHTDTKTKTCITAWADHLRSVYYYRFKIGSCKHTNLSTSRNSYWGLFRFPRLWSATEWQSSWGMQEYHPPRCRCMVSWDTYRRRARRASGRECGWGRESRASPMLGWVSRQWVGVSRCMHQSKRNRATASTCVPHKLECCHDCMWMWYDQSCSELEVSRF